MFSSCKLYTAKAENIFNPIGKFVIILPKFLCSMDFSFFCSVIAVYKMSMRN